ncbi:MAG TPA: hypothetical protein VHW72_15830 [Candidatus Angelobacter sp.]|jgi:hypothetical protein|nr:hypothetical protein [Candidatus Angelobacter sp.]
MKSHRISRSGVLVIIAAFGLAAIAGNAPRGGNGLRPTLPAGYDVVALKPSGANLSLMGLIECPELEGAQSVAEGVNKKLVSADGDTIRHFPQRFSFRITASLRKMLMDRPAASVDISDEPQELLLNLKFRIRAYNGLENHEIVPESVEMIGMPADVPYDERVYRINVNNVDLPITARLVVEIRTPQGELLTHFPFSLL